MKYSRLVRKYCKLDMTEVQGEKFILSCVVTHIVLLLLSSSEMAIHQTIEICYLREKPQYLSV